MKKIAIIGAGPSGLSAAYKLSKTPDVEVHVFESSSQIGGMGKSISLWGHVVDLGPHRFFSNDTKINKLWLEVVGNNYSMVPRQTRIYYKKKFFNYPLRPLGALMTLGFFEAIRCGLSYFWTLCSESILPTKDKKSFEDWVKSRFGRRLYEVFFKSYTEKLWGIPCHELDSDFAAQRIKKLSLFEVIKNAFSFNKTKHMSLVEQFAYPNDGSGFVYDRMLEAIESNGGKIHFNKKLKYLFHVDGNVEKLKFEDGSSYDFDEVVSTMPLNLLVDGLGPMPLRVKESLKKLKFRNTVLVYLHIEGQDLFTDNWLYVQDAELACGRITNFSNWGAFLNKGKKTTVLCMEFWANEEDEFWNSDDKDIAQLAQNEWKKTKLSTGEKVLDTKVIRIPKSYPVYSLGYKEDLSIVTEYLDTFKNLHPIGRYGSFKYNNQDHCFLMGILVAENILNGARHNLWDVNTDYEVYHEKALITETGLESQCQDTEKKAA